MATNYIDEISTSSGENDEPLTIIINDGKPLSIAPTSAFRPIHTPSNFLVEANEIVNIRIHSDSPYKNNSSSESDLDKSSMSTGGRKQRRGYKRLSYADIVNSLSHYYDDCTKYSNELDILISYIRGQKHVFIHCAYLTNLKLYSLFITALSITSFITVVTPFIKDYWWSFILITCGNAIAATLISIINYFKLETACSTYSFLANNYEKFENSLEIANNKLSATYTDQEHTQVVIEKIKDIEYKIGEVRELSQILIPEEIKPMFPVLTHLNIFAFIKKIESHKNNLIIKFKDIKNEINYHLYHINSVDLSRSIRSVYELDKTQETQRVLFLTELKEKVKTELLNYKEAYHQLDYIFNKEIQYAEKHVPFIGCINIYHWCFAKPKYLDVSGYTNPVIVDYMKLLFDTD